MRIAIYDGEIGERRDDQSDDMQKSHNTRAGLELAASRKNTMACGPKNARSTYGDMAAAEAAIVRWLDHRSVIERQDDEKREAPLLDFLRESQTRLKFDARE